MHYRESAHDPTLVPDYRKWVDVLGERNVVGPELAEQAFGVKVKTIPDVPFNHEKLLAAKERGEILIFRPNTAQDGAPLTIQKMVEIIEEMYFNNKRLLKNLFAKIHFPGWSDVLGNFNVLLSEKVGQAVSLAVSRENRKKAGQQRFSGQAFYSEQAPRAGWALLSSSTLSARNHVDAAAMLNKVLLDMSAINPAEFEENQSALQLLAPNLTAASLQRTPEKYEEAVRGFSRMRLNREFHRTPVEVAYDLIQQVVIRETTDIKMPFPPEYENATVAIDPGTNQFWRVGYSASSELFFEQTSPLEKAQIDVQRTA